MYQMIRLQLLAGACANITVGVFFLFFPDVMMRYIGFDPATNQLFRLFVSGVAIGLGMGYAYTYRADPDNLSLLFFGTCLKYWAFAVTLYCFMVHDLSLFMFLLFGIGNLVLAFNFTLFMYFRQRT